MPPMLKVSLTYFKESGKYYAEGEFNVEASIALFEVWAQVRTMMDKGELPGLCEGGGKGFSILVNVSGHRHGHPHLIHPDSNGRRA